MASRLNTGNGLIGRRLDPVANDAEPTRAAGLPLAALVGPNYVL